MLFYLRVYRLSLVARKLRKLSVLVMSLSLMEQREPLHAWMHPIKRAKFDLITKKILQGDSGNYNPHLQLAFSLVDNSHSIFLDLSMGTSVGPFKLLCFSFFSLWKALRFVGDSVQNTRYMSSE